MRALIGIFALAASAPTLAAGGPHVVDDSEVEDAGVCHLETWVTRRSPSTAVGFAAPACTPKSIRWLEIGALASYGPARDEYGLGPAIKATLRSSDKGLGIGLDLAANWSHDARRFETASVIVPLTLKASRTLDISANAGWLYTRSGSDSALFTGLQAMWQPTGKLGVMVEAFDRTDGVFGSQAGVRLTPVEWLDLDATASRAFDGSNHFNVTLGAIVRWGHKAA